MFDLLQEALIIKLNRTINSLLFEVLSFAPQNEVFNKNFNKLNGKIIKLQLKKSQFQSQFLNQYVISFTANKILIKQVKNNIEQPYDLLVNLSLYGLVKAQVNSVQKALQDGDLELSGDIGLAMTLQLLFTNAEFNIKDLLQEKLAANFSEIFAWQFIKMLDTVFSRVSEKKSEVFEQIVEYLQLEKNILVNKCEVDDYCHAVDKLREDVDRLAARINLLG